MSRSPFTRINSSLVALRLPAILLALALAFVGVASPSVQAAARSLAFQQPADRAHSFLRTAARGQEVLQYVHMGAKYRGHEYLRTASVQDQRGNAVSSQFALVYRFWWEDDGITDVAFICDSRGTIQGVDIVWTNAIWNRPFVFANAAIKLVGSTLVGLYKDQMSDSDRQWIQGLIRDADSKGILEWLLTFKQAFSD